MLLLQAAFLKALSASHWNLVKHKQNELALRGENSGDNLHLSSGNHAQLSASL